MVHILYKEMGLFLLIDSMHNSVSFNYKFCVLYTLKNKVCIAHKNVLHDTILVSSSTFWCQAAHFGVKQHIFVCNAHFIF